MAKLVKSHSNYILRSQHQKTVDGSIFERDYMTISSQNGYSPDGTPIYGDSNFRFITTEGLNFQRRHSHGSWIFNDARQSDQWKSSDVNRTEEASESKVVLKKDYNSLKDFAYYGSASDLIRGSILDIIQRFPAELYFPPESDAETIIYSGVKYYVVDNDYDINADLAWVGNKEIDNPLRYLSVSITDYAFITPTTTSEMCASACNIRNREVTCEQEESGAITAEAIITIESSNHTIYVYSKAGKKKLIYKDTFFSNCRLRPKSELVEAFWESLDEFERVLLDRTSNPIYMSVFDTPFETNEGYGTRKRSYTWPSKYGYNPDISSSQYYGYLDRLMSLAEYHDEFDSDNIWRSMTHEAIKNMDLTYTKVNSTGGIESEGLDTTRIEPILKLYGRAYDNIKNYIDGVCYINNISYNGKNNMPDYYLTDSVANSGFEVIVVNPTTDNTVRTPILYDGDISGYNASDTNIEFMRRLKLNARYLLSEKGTRKGIEDLLALFGFAKNSGYTIDETVVLITGSTKGTASDLDCSTSSTYRGSFLPYETICCYNKQRDDYAVSDSDPLYGLPMRGISYYVGANEETYVVPWFDKNRTYLPNIYFQMNGGWGKCNRKKISNPIAPSISYIEATEDVKLYDETVSSLQYAGTLEEMLYKGNLIVKTGDICYVENIDGIDELYAFAPGEISDGFSHYFVLKDMDYSSFLGCYDAENNVYGWKNILTVDIENMVGDGLRVLYLDSIIDSTIGNAPHFGNRKYDDGEEYVERMTAPFKDTTFSKLDDIQTKAIHDTSFNYKTSVDNKKCWFFTDTLKVKNYSQLKKENNRYIVEPNPKQDPTVMTKISGGTEISDNTLVSPERNINNKCDECVANTIMNDKRIKITFNASELLNNQGSTDISALMDYIETVVMFYVKQMVPSSAILEYEIN